MAEEQPRKFDLPWGTLLPLLAVLAGVVAQYKPLVSERPSVASEETAPVFAAQDVDARLWQDPIGVAQKQKSLLDARIEGGYDKDGVGSKLHDIPALTELLSQDVRTFFSKTAPVPVLLLAVMLDAGPYSEQAESWPRASTVAVQRRVAVLLAIRRFPRKDIRHLMSGEIAAETAVDDPERAWPGWFFFT